MHAFSILYLKCMFSNVLQINTRRLLADVYLFYIWLPVKMWRYFYENSLKVKDSEGPFHTNLPWDVLHWKEPVFSPPLIELQGYLASLQPRWSLQVLCTKITLKEVIMRMMEVGNVIWCSPFDINTIRYFIKKNIFPFPLWKIGHVQTSTSKQTCHFFLFIMNQYS